MFGLPLLTWTVRSEADRDARRTLGRPDDFRGLSAVSLTDRDGHSESAHPRSCRAIADVPAARLGRLRQSSIELLKFTSITHSSRMLFCPRWKPPARPRRAPAGSRSTSSPRPTTAPSLGVVPCYLKSHSRGEYVFDAGWAEAYERAGGSYYPKLQVSVPFTPATGRRLLVRAGRRRRHGARRAAAGLIELCRMREASSVHVTFLPEAEWRLLGEHGFLQRTDQQFHWENAGYATFDDFLAALVGAQAQGDPARAARGARARHQRALADRHGPDRRASGTPSSRSTWRPARANGAGRTSRASSIR